IALATSSPFWQSQRTGLRGYRLAAYDELPRTGVPELFRTRMEFEAYVDALVRAGVMPDASFIWWAMRPSTTHPTLELRAPDCCTRLEDTVAIAALYRTLARRVFLNRWLNADLTAVSRAIIVENKWRAQRYGIHGTFVDEARPREVPFAHWLDQVIEEAADDMPLPRRRRADGSLNCYLCWIGSSPDISRHVCTMIWFGARGVLVSCGRTVPWRRRTRERVGLFAGLRRQQIADKGSSVGLWVMPRV
ncbi:MAG: glutamate-cysteine ligase family protein, partial [Xanthobacteraceae bacterium]